MQSLKRAGGLVVRGLSTHASRPPKPKISRTCSTAPSDSLASAANHESEVTTCGGHDSQLINDPLDPLHSAACHNATQPRGLSTNLVKLWKRAKAALFDSALNDDHSLSLDLESPHLQPSKLLGLKPHLLRVREAAEHGDLGSMITLGRAYLYGHLGVAVDKKTKAQGLMWLTKAAQLSSQLYPQGPYELARAYEQLSCVRDRDRARELYALAATKYHFAPAAACLGLAYATSDSKLNCSYDPTRSIHFYTIAAYSGDPESMMALCDWHLACVSTLVSNTPDKYRSAHRNQKLAFEWANNAARHGLPRAMYMLGHCYAHGVGVHRSHKRGLLWYEAAARAGYLSPLDNPKALKCYS